MTQEPKEIDIRDNMDLKEALDRGIDDMEAGREHPLDEAIQIVDSLIEKRLYAGV